MYCNFVSLPRIDQESCRSYKLHVGKVTKTAVPTSAGMSNIQNLQAALVVQILAVCTFSNHCGLGLLATGYGAWCRAALAAAAAALPVARWACFKKMRSCKLPALSRVGTFRSGCVMLVCCSLWCEVPYPAGLLEDIFPNGMILGL